MLNILWACLLVIGIITAAFTGNLEAVNNSILESTQDAVELLIVMTGIMSINGTLQLFDESINLTKGGPAQTTETMSHYIYDAAWQNHSFGYASAMSFLIFIMVAILSLINLKVGDSRD